MEGQGGKSTPLEAKSSGGKGGYKKHGATLNIQLWSQTRVSAMKEIIQARYRCDELFRNILKETKKQNFYLVHFERSGQRSFWGASVVKEIDSAFNRNDGLRNIKGGNQLGKIMMEFRDAFEEEDTNHNNHNHQNKDDNILKFKQHDPKKNAFVLMKNSTPERNLINNDIDEETGEKLDIERKRTATSIRNSQENDASVELKDPVEKNEVEITTKEPKRFRWLP
eukprot:Awhi_evm1s3173